MKKEDRSEFGRQNMEGNKDGIDALNNVEVDKDTIRRAKNAARMRKWRIDNPEKEAEKKLERKEYMRKRRAENEDSDAKKRRIKRAHRLKQKTKASS